MKWWELIGSHSSWSDCNPSCYTFFFFNSCKPATVFTIYRRLASCTTIERLPTQAYCVSMVRVRIAIADAQAAVSHWYRLLSTKRMPYALHNWLLHLWHYNFTKKRCTIANPIATVFVVVQMSWTCDFTHEHDSLDFQISVFQLENHQRL